MPYVLNSRVGITTQIPASFAIKLGETAETLGVSRHRLTVLALFAGLEIAADQIRSGQVAKVTKPSSSDARE